VSLKKPESERFLLFQPRAEVLDMRHVLRIPRWGASGARVLWTLALVALTLPQLAEAQPRPTRPDVPRLYAIQGARVVTVSGRTIDNGTVVVSNGIITAVGSDVSVPRGAWVIDASGKTVYPGFIDAMTDLGHPRARGQQQAQESPFGPRGGGDDGDHSWGPEDRPGTHSDLSAGEELDGSDGRLERWRSAGFTTVLSTRDVGLVTDQAAVLDLGLFDHPREMVVATPVAMHLKLFDRSYSGYPASLLGSFAYLKQLYLDAQHYRAVWADYRSSPRGKSRPEWDPTLEPIAHQLDAGYPVLFPAGDRKEIERAIVTSQTLGVKPVVYGAQGAYAATDLLADHSVAAVVSLDWPGPARDADPGAEPSLETLRLWDRAPTTPAQLSKAGVRFAFTSGGLSDPSEMLTNARQAVVMGLGKDAAVRAFTLDAARILGVDDRLGSIEEGKLANLVVASGDLMDPGSRVETVFVDGDRFDVPAPEAPRNRRGQADDDQEAGAPVAMAKDKGAYRDDPVTFIRNATVMTASHGVIQNGSILIRDGKIAAVGTDIEAPSGAHVVDASGKWVIPGIIDCHSHIAADAINEGAVNVSSMVKIKDVLNPDDPNIYWAVAGGVTSINVLHGSANPIGGGNAVIKLRWGSDAQDLLVDGAHLGIKFALGENVKRDRDPDRYPATRMGVQDVIRQAFLDARAYQKEWDAWEAGGRQGVQPRRDLKLEALAQVLSGERWIHAHSYRADEIVQLMDVADEFGVTVRTLQHVLEGYKVADEIAAHGTGASTFSDWWAYKVEAYDAIPYNAKIMQERGVLVSINSDSGEEMRHLNQEAAKSIKWGGMSREDALRMVTLNPAKQLGIDEHQGSIDVGKDADLAMYDGDPLSMFSKVVQTYIDGKLYFDLDLDRERHAAIEKEKAALLERYAPGGADAQVAPDRIAPKAFEEVGR
jgi:imidazolonepropionase-like amidohydrolase